MCVSYHEIAPCECVTVKICSSCPSFGGSSNFHCILFSHWKVAHCLCKPSLPPPSLLKAAVLTALSGIPRLIRAEEDSRMEFQKLDYRFRTVGMVRLQLSSESPRGFSAKALCVGNEMKRAAWICISCFWWCCYLFTIGARPVSSQFKYKRLTIQNNWWASSPYKS